MKKEKFEFIQKNLNNEEALSGISRRELLEVGAITFAARLIVPSFAGILATLNSAESRAQTMNSWAPFITINLEGGASLHGNIIARDQGGQLLKSYSFHGLGAEAQPVKYLGVVFDKRSQLMAGIQSVLSSSASSKVQGAVFCTNTASDTRALAPLRPQYDLSPVIEKTGRMGQFFSSLEFNGASTSLRSFHDGSPNSRLSVASSAQVLDALSLTAAFSSTVTVGGVAQPRYSREQKRGLASLIGKLAQRQLSGQTGERYQRNGQSQVEATKALEQIVGGSVSGRDIVDPTKNAEATAVYGLTATATDATKTKAAVAYSSIMGYASSSFMHLGGYDYHFPGTREAANRKDFEAGVEIGRILELAHRLKKPVFVFIATDGANFSANSESSSSIWSADTSASMQLVLAYSPLGLKLAGNNEQVGHYLQDQSVDKNTLVGDRSDYVAAAVMGNYLAMHGREADLTKVAPATITSANISKIVRIVKA